MHIVEVFVDPDSHQQIPAFVVSVMLMYLFFFRSVCFFFFIEDENDGVEVGLERPSSELSNLNEDWDSGM